MHQNLVAQSSETMEQSGQQHWPLIRVVLVVSRDYLLLLRNMFSLKKKTGGSSYFVRYEILCKLTNLVPKKHGFVKLFKIYGLTLFGVLLSKLGR